MDDARLAQHLADGQPSLELAFRSETFDELLTAARRVARQADEARVSTVVALAHAELDDPEATIVLRVVLDAIVARPAQVEIADAALLLEQSAVPEDSAALRAVRQLAAVWAAENAVRSAPSQPLVAAAREALAVVDEPGLVLRLEAIVQGPRRAPNLAVGLDGGDNWAPAVRAALGLLPAEDRAGIGELLKHLSTMPSAAQPTAAWRRRCLPVLAGCPRAAATLHLLLQTAAEAEDVRSQAWTPNRGVRACGLHLAPSSTSVVRGAVWATVALDPAWTLDVFDALLRRAARPETGKGASTPTLAITLLYALATLGAEGRACVEAQAPAITSKKILVHVDRVLGDRAGTAEARSAPARAALARRRPEPAAGQTRMQDVYRDVLRERVAPRLRAAGLTGSGRSYELREPDGSVALLGLFGCDYNTPQELTFRLRCEAWPVRLWRFRALAYGLDATRRPRFGCSAYFATSATTWTLSADTDAAALADEIVAAVEAALPDLRLHLTEAGMAEHLWSCGNGSGPPPTFALLPLSILLPDGDPRLPAVRAVLEAEATIAPHLAGAVERARELRADPQA